MLSSWGRQHSVCLLWLHGSECRFPRSDQSSLCGGVWICWESMNSKWILAIDYGCYSSPYECLHTGLNFELRLCCSGKKLNHNHILIWAGKRSPIRNLQSAGVWLILTFTGLSAGQEVSSVAVLDVLNKEHFACSSLLFNHLTLCSFFRGCAE